MNEGLGRKLFYRLRCVYFGFGLLIAAGMVLSKIFVSRGGAADVAFVLRGMAFGYAIVLVFLCLFTYVRLCVPVNRAMAEEDESGRANALWLRLTRFPLELRYAYLGFAFGAAVVYKLASWEWSLWSRETVAELIKGLLFDLTTFAAFALLHEAAVRWLLLARVRSLRVYGQKPSQFYSAIRTLMLIAGCGIVYVQLRLYGYADASFREGESPHVAVLLSIGAVVFVLTALAVWVAATLLFRELDRMTARFWEGRALPRRQLLDRLPVSSAYEPGELATAFNRLQERLAREYSRLDKELQLAQRVQQQQLSVREGVIGHWRISADCHRNEDVDGRFYDWTETGDGRIVLAAGCVAGGGLPSALIMSAVLLLLRSGLSGEGSAAEKLTELETALEGVLSSELHVHIALAVLDPERCHLQWAVAGEAEIAVEAEGSRGHRAGGAANSPPLGLPYAERRTAYRSDWQPGASVTVRLAAVSDMRPQGSCALTAIRERGEPNGRIL